MADEVMCAWWRGMPALSNGAAALAGKGRRRYLLYNAIPPKAKRMRPTSKIPVGLVHAALLAVAIGAAAAPPAAARGLSGGFRASFLKIFGEGCMKSAVADPDIAKLPKATLISFCRCSAVHIADRATPEQLDRPDSLATVAIQAEATRACLPR